MTQATVRQRLAGLGRVEPRSNLEKDAIGRIWPVWRVRPASALPPARSAFGVQISDCREVVLGNTAQALL